MSEELFEELVGNDDSIVAAQKLARSVQQTYFDLGCLLYNIKERDLYKTYQGGKYYSDEHSKWKEFVSDNFDVGERSARYWMDIYRYFTDMGVPKERLIHIGWSKAKEMINATDNTNELEKLLVVAEERNITELKKAVAEVKKETQKLGEDTREELKKFTFKFTFFEEMGESVKEILDEAAKDSGGDHSQALAKICIEWLQTKHLLDVDPIPEEYESDLIKAYA